MGATRIKQILREMVEDGLLIAEGENRNRRYRAVAEIPEEDIRPRH